MDTFIKIYRKLLMQQQQESQQMQDSIIFQADPWGWIKRRVIKPVAGTVEGVADAVDSIASKDLKRLGQNIKKIITNPIQLVSNIATAPIDIIQAAVELVKKDPKGAKQTASQAAPISKKDIQTSASQNSDLANAIKNLPPDKQKLIAQLVAIMNATKKQTAKAAAKQTNNQSANNQSTNNQSANNQPTNNQPTNNQPANTQKKNGSQTAKQSSSTASSSTDDAQIKEYMQVAIPAIAQKTGKEQTLIQTRMKRRIENGKIMILKDGKVTVISIDDFKKDFASYMQAIEDAAGQLKKNADAENKNKQKQKLIKKLIDSLIANKIRYTNDQGKKMVATSQGEIIRYWNQIGPEVAKMKSFSQTSTGKANFELLDTFCKSRQVQ